MKTSPTQFYLLVTFMEQHGDISKFWNHPQGKIYTYRKWAELTELLNSDGSGASKTEEKWRKVWADFKNNTKRKNARIYRSARGMGRCSMTALLSDLEKRVLKLNNIQSVSETGSEDVSEAVLPQHVREHLDSSTSQQHNPIDVPLDKEKVVLQIKDDECLSSNSTATSPNIQSNWSPAPGLTPPATTGQPTSSQRSTSQRALPRKRSHYRPYTPADRAAKEFIHSDKEWRKFHVEKNSQQLALEQERLRLRALELQFHNRLADIGDRIVDILEKILV